MLWKQRIQYLAKFQTDVQQYPKFLNTGQLPQLYQSLDASIQWLNAIAPFVKSTQTMKKAQDHLGFIQNNIINFCLKYINTHTVMGDQTVVNHPDIMIVLGGPKDILVQRLKAALIYARKFKSMPIILSGGGRTAQSEADYMFRFMVKHRIGKSRLFKEELSLDTVGNVVFSNLLMKQKKYPLHILG